MLTHPSALSSARQRIAAILRRLLAPPPRLRGSEWADERRMLSSEASAEPGRFNVSRAEYQREWLDCISDPTVEEACWMVAAQTGKTEVMNCMVGYKIDLDPGPMLVLQPTVEMAEMWSKDRLSPMLRDTPALHGKVADPRSRDSGNTLRHKAFTGGHITMVGANSPASLSARPIRDVLADEVDRYPQSAGGATKGEGSPLALARKRTATFWNRKVFRWSTPTIKGASEIERDYDASDQRRYYVPCPDCEHKQTLKWSNLQWENNDPATAQYACERCGVLIEERHKHWMLSRGEWVAENPGARVRGYHLNALYSPWARWEELVREWLAAKDNPELLKVFVNTVLAETWEERGEKLNAEGIAGRRETYAAEVPMGVGVLAHGVDVHPDRLESMVRGWGQGEESWLIRHDVLWGDPDKPEVWQDLESLRVREYRHESGAGLYISASCIDSGGNNTEAVYRYVKGKQRTWAIKGQSQLGKALVGRPSKTNRHGVRVLPLGVDAAKDIIFSRLKKVEAGPRYMHFGANVPDEYFTQLTAEKLVTRYVKGRAVRVYECPKGTRNEALDLEVYAYAALVSLTTVVLDNLGTYAKRVQAEGAAKVPEPAQSDEPEAPPEPQPAFRQPQAVRRTGWTTMGGAIGGRGW
jgi:phage terminase large subunit GpA-like protein